METIILQAGGIMGATYYLIDLVKPFLPEEAKKFIPFMSAVIAGVLNAVIAQEAYAQNFLAGVLMGLSTSKGYDLKNDLKKPLVPYEKENEIE